MNNVKEGQTENTKITKKKKKLPGRSIYATSPKITIRIILTNLFYPDFSGMGLLSIGSHCPTSKQLFDLSAFEYKSRQDNMAELSDPIQRISLCY